MSNRLEPSFLIVAEVLRPHGVRGEIRVRILTDFPERLQPGKMVYLGRSAAQEQAESLTLARVRLQDDYGILQLEGIDNRNDVEHWRGLFLMIPIDEAVPLEEDEFYAYQLIGMTLLNESGHVIGEISDIMETGANDVLVVSSSEYGEILIPDIPGMWVELDFDEGFATARLPDGLLPSS